LLNDLQSIEAASRKFDRRYCELVQPSDPPGYSGPSHYFVAHCAFTSSEYLDWLRIGGAEFMKRKTSER
jgi:hypothetical protein